MQELIDCLRGCPTGFSQHNGLCTNVIQCTNMLDRRQFHQALRAVLPSWQYYSGNEYFPVSVEYTSECSYGDAMVRGTMYDGEYGRRRIELANLIADELERQLCKS